MNDDSMTEKHQQICELVYRSKEFFSFLECVLNNQNVADEIKEQVNDAINKIRFFVSLGAFYLEDESMQSAYDKGKSIAESKDLKHKETGVIPKIFYKSDGGCIYELIINEIHQSEKGGLMNIYTSGGPIEII